MSADNYDPEFFHNLGMSLLHRSTVSASLTTKRRFRAYYGVTHTVSYKLWLNLRAQIPENCKPCHLLWTLNFLKTYDTEMVRSALFRVDEKTMRKWQWIVIDAISNLKLVRYFYFI